MIGAILKAVGFHMSPAKIHGNSKSEDSHMNQLCHVVVVVKPCPIEAVMEGNCVMVEMVQDEDEGRLSCSRCRPGSCWQHRRADGGCVIAILSMEPFCVNVEWNANCSISQLFQKCRQPMASLSNKHFVFTSLVNTKK